jgi:hypothetical protein
MHIPSTVFSSPKPDFPTTQSLSTTNQIERSPQSAPETNAQIQIIFHPTNQTHKARQTQKLKTTDHKGN